MTLEAKGRIKFNPDVKHGEPQYIIEAKQLGVVETGSGNIEQMMNELTERVRRAISEEFCVAPASVEIVGYAMGVTFAVEGPVNHTLQDFMDAAKDVVGDSSVIAVQVSRKTGVPPKI